MKGNSKMDMQKEEVPIIFLMVKNMLGIINKTKEMDMEYIFILMVTNILENLKTEKKMVKVFYMTKMEIRKKRCILTMMKELKKII